MLRVPELPTTIRPTRRPLANKRHDVQIRYADHLTYQLLQVKLFTEFG